MADFCKQCAIAHGFTPNDLCGISTVDDTAQGLFAVVICEGCGFIQVDHDGNCQGGPDCLEGHQPASET